MRLYFEAVVAFLVRVLVRNPDRQRGATMIEYALIIAVVSIALVFAANAVLDGSLDKLGDLVKDALGGNNPNP